MNRTNVAEKVFGPVAGCLTPEVAQRIVDLRLDSDAEQRLELLGTKANRGQLTEEERGEYEVFVEYLDILAILQVRARILLKQSRS